VTLKSFQLAEAYAGFVAKNKSINPKAEISNMEKMLMHLLEKLADNKYTKKAEAAYLKFFAID
jgi:phage I-like protein